MTDLSYFFSPIQFPETPYNFPDKIDTIGNYIEYYNDDFPDWLEADLIVIGCPEDRGTITYPGCAKAPDIIRHYLYSLTIPEKSLKMVDLGNLNYNPDLESFYLALQQVLQVLLRKNKTVIVLGGTQDLSYPLYCAFEQTEQLVEYVSIDHSPDIFDSEVELTNISHNHKIITHDPNYLYHFSLLGAQHYLLSPEERQIFEILNYEIIRIGDIRKNIRIAEPYLRQAALISLDVSVIRHAEAPGSSHPSPGGFTIDELCQILRFAGMGYNSNCLLVSELNPELDIHNQTAHTVAIAIWYFIHGYYNRLYDQPRADRSNLQAYRVALSGPVKEIKFFKHENTQRWWVEIPSPLSLRGSNNLNHLVPCSELDYHLALQDEIPNRWWVMHNKFE